MFYTLSGQIGKQFFGIESAQKRRHDLFKEIGVDHRFLYFDLPIVSNVYQRFADLGIDLANVVLVYDAFTDIKPSVATYRLKDFEETYLRENHQKNRISGGVVYRLPDGKEYRCQVIEGEIVPVVQCFEGQRLVETLFFTSQLKNKLTYRQTPGEYLHTYYLASGEVAYTIFEKDGQKQIRFKDRLFESEEAFFSYYIDSLALSRRDILYVEHFHPKLYFLLDPVKRRGSQLGYHIHFDFTLPISDGQTSILERLFPLQQIDFFAVGMQSQVQQLRTRLPDSTKAVYLPVFGVNPPVSGRLRDFVSDTPLNLVTVSRLSPEKRVDLLLRVVKAAKDKGAKVKLDIYGDGELRQELEKLCLDLSITEEIQFHGFERDQERMYRDAHFYLSTSETEAVATSVLEAMSYGLPIIARDLPIANQEYITQGQNGYLIASQDDEDLIDKMSNQVLSLCQLDQAVYTGLQTEAQTTSRRYSKESMIAQHQTVLKQLNSTRHHSKMIKKKKRKK